MIINFSIKEAAPIFENVCCSNLLNVLRLTLSTGTKFKHSFKITVSIKKPLSVITVIYKLISFSRLQRESCSNFEFKIEPQSMKKFLPYIRNLLQIRGSTPEL